MNIAFFGSTLLSACRNGACTYYRGLLRELVLRGHQVTFYEPDAYDRQKHRDPERVDFADCVVYSADGDGALIRALQEARHADVIIKAGGGGVFDELLEREIAGMRSSRRKVLFWDVDAPATLARISGNEKDAFRELIPAYDHILTCGGGPPVIERYHALGARNCVPVYNALDQTAHYPVMPDTRFEADLSFLGNRLPEREEQMNEFFFKPVSLLPQRRFLLGGNGWDKPADNLTAVGSVCTNDHNAFNSSPRAVLNINRDGREYSPAAGFFEAAGAGACIITNAWEGIEIFLEPGAECLLAKDGDEVAMIVDDLSCAQALHIGLNALQRIQQDHTYAKRAEQVDRILKL